MRKTLRTYGAAAILAVLSVSAVDAQMTLPAYMRGPAIKGANRAQLEHGQTVYVLADCHLCHGFTLAEARGGGADLGGSRLVQMDTDGDIIGPIVHAGLPRTQSAMPAYPNMSAEDLRDMAAYIHYMRQILHEKKALAAPLAGSPAAGRAYFFDRCAACHNGAGDLSTKAKALEPAALRARLVRPFPITEAAPAGSAHAAHLKLLEALSPADAVNLAVYLQTMDGPITLALAKAMEPPPREPAKRFEEKCAPCHGPGGSGGDRGPPLVNSLVVEGAGVDGIKAIVAHGLPGGMPAFRMSDRELQELATFLKAKNPVVVWPPRRQSAKGVK